MYGRGRALSDYGERCLERIYGVRQSFEWTVRWKVPLQPSFHTKYGGKNEMHASRALIFGILPGA